jgi:hypothetical protein
MSELIMMKVQRSPSFLSIFTGVQRSTFKRSPTRLAVHNKVMHVLLDMRHFGWGTMKIEDIKAG